MGETAREACCGALAPRHISHLVQAEPYGRAYETLM
jgi:hypothetical protein